MNLFSAEKSVYTTAPQELTTKQIEMGKGRVWKATAHGESAMRSREIDAIRELLRKLGCDTTLADCYRPHKTIEDKVVLGHV